MLAAHRDQENVVYSRQVPTKQAPKTPGPRFPKTPSGFGRHDENALGTLGAKGAAGDGKSLVKGLGASQMAITPMAPHTRAVLGDKTTNAKARTGQGKNGGPKGFDKSQPRLSPVRRHKAKPASSRKLFLAAPQEVEPEHDEPEYAPPRPKDLPYQSDVLPKGGLSFEGIKKGNLLKGYYQHFHHDVDDRGLSRYDRLLNDEMTAVLEEAVQRNDEQTDRFSWGIDAILEEPQQETSGEARQPQEVSARIAPLGRDASITSRHAAAALAMQAPNSRNVSVTKTRSAPSTKEPCDLVSSAHIGTTIGEAASRTSIGYAKGRSTSSVLRPREETSESFSARAKRVVPIMGGTDTPLTMTPCLSRSGPADDGSADDEVPRPAFMSIFDGDFDNYDLAGISVPFEESDEEEFELRMDV